MNDEDFAEFLQDASLWVHDLWVKWGGDEMKAMELQALNDALTVFFGDKRSVTNELE